MGALKVASMPQREMVDKPSSDLDEIQLRIQRLQNELDQSKINTNMYRSCTDTIQNTLNNIWNQLKVTSTQKNKINRAGNSDE